MCLILFSYRKHKKYRLILAANRDEFYARPTEPLSKWDGSDGIIAGRDIEAGGTWMGVSEKGRFAALTNFRDPESVKKDALSRGFLVSGFFGNPETAPKDYLAAVSRRQNMYNGFNLLAGDNIDLFYFSNREGIARKLEPGIYGLSNHLVNTPWPKVEKGKKQLEMLVESGEFENPEKIFELLGDTELPDDSLLPETGMGIEWERILAPLFIKSEIYGTRSSSFLVMDYEGKGFFMEKTWVKNGQEVAEGKIRTVKF